jgi:hypothetical protein
MNISDTLFKFNSEKLPENFVSIATKIVDKIPTHAAILIRYKNKHFLHHFPGSTKPEVIDDFNEDGWYVYKILESLSYTESEVGSVLGQCYRICLKSDITYSFIADGSSHKDDGEFVSRVGLPEFGTCVGFCANTLTTAIIDVKDDYFNLDDWDDSEINERIDVWSTMQAAKKYPDLDWTLYKAFKKRIKPLDYLCSAFLTNYPISKADISIIEDEVQEAINNLYR